MELTLTSRLKSAWNVFLNRDPTVYTQYHGPSTTYRPDRIRLTRRNERTIITSIFNRIAIDCASIELRHAKVDEDERFLEKIKSSLNYCLIDEANIDQTGRLFRQDIVMSMLSEGHVVILPVETDTNPDSTGSYNIKSMRTGRVVDWYPRHVKVEAYNEITGRKEEIIVAKSSVGIVENPLYEVMNEPNSTMQRLVRKLALLDRIDEDSNSGKLDLIIQLPYVVKTETRRKQAEERRKMIEDQLANSKYGIAYTDGTENIVQLNRAVENNLMSQIEYLTSMLYSQLGITKEILDGTANEQTMINYHNRTIEPILSAIADEMKRKFLTKTARTQGQTITFFRDPFRLAPIEKIAEISDKMTRNEIMSSNEIRQKIGMKPSSDPKADELRNKNLNQQAGDQPSDQASATNQNGEGYDAVTGILKKVESGIDRIASDAMGIPSVNSSDSDDSLMDSFLKDIESQINQM